ncbi:MAG: bifunctional riboflavin kinase/FAD synthetase [Planctomycetota bacterium]|jgi:riboflavin kinase/FMN adenylyltransferase
MKIIEATSGLAELAKVEKGCVLTVGNFDGVHLGHQQILTAAKQTAAKRAAQLVVMTFEPHPLAILHPEKAPGILTPVALKEHLLAEFGVDCLFVVESTRRLLALTPHDFVQRFLVENIGPGVVVEGESFNFGSGRGGNVHTLQELGAEKGFEVSIVQAKEVKLSTGKTVKISSTIIRGLLASGSVADAALTLGRAYRLIGQVVAGKGRGKQLGFPTLNMQPLSQLVPAEGVYAGLVEIGDTFEKLLSAKEKIPSALSIGRLETFGSDNPLAIEAHILTNDVSGLHGQWLAMDFIKRIRDQQKFETDADLSAQIAKDCKKAKEILATEDTETTENSKRCL